MGDGVKIMRELQNVVIQCPYCGEQIEVTVDCSDPSMEYIEDCSVCCRPITISVMCSDGAIVAIEGRTEDE